MAKLSDAYAAAYEGDVQFAAGPGQRSYLVQRARRHRRDAQLRRAAAQDLRSIAGRTRAVRNASPDLLRGDDLQAELESLGIAPVQLTVFDWGGYRYSNARDAIAAAKRRQASAG